MRSTLSDLNNHPLLSCRDLSQFRESMAATNSIEKIDVIGKRSEVDVTINGLTFDDLSLAHFAYGSAPTRFVASEGPDVMQMIVTTSGGGVASHRKDSFEMSETVGFMRNMACPHVSLLSDIQAVALSVPLGKLRQHAQALLGEEVVTTDLVFDGSFDMTTPEATHLRNTLDYVTNALNGPSCNLDNEISLKGFSDLLLTTVLTHLPNSYSERLLAPSAPKVVPYHVKRARDYIHANAACTITLEALASYAGCAYRTLQQGYTDAYGVPPMRYLRYLRLSRVRDALLNAEDGNTVKAVASRWGFSDLGRFAREYRDRYGELPSETLRRRG